MPSFDSCPCEGNTLDRLIQPAILLVLMDGPLHGYRVAEQIGEMPSFSHRPDVSGVYRFLKAMEKKGLVTSAWDLSDSGPAKRCFQITDDGQQCLTTWITTLEKYRDGINSLLRAARRSTNQMNS